MAAASVNCDSNASDLSERKYKPSRRPPNFVTNADDSLGSFIVNHVGDFGVHLDNKVRLVFVSACILVYIDKLCSLRMTNASVQTFARTLFCVYCTTKYRFLEQMQFWGIEIQILLNLKSSNASTITLNSCLVIQNFKIV